MKSDSLKKNFVFQIVYQVIILVIPLVLSPYLTRVLKDTALGIYAYTYTIAYYFVLISMLGINKYGQKIIATAREDQINLRTEFWSLFILHILISVSVSLLYFCVVLFFINDNKTIYLIQGFYVVSALFDITWLFYGLEIFKKVVIRNAVLKIIECVLIFTLVKTSGDLWIYTLIMGVSALIGQIMMLPFALKHIKPIRISRGNLTKHIKPLLVFSIAVIGAVLYAVFDKTLLGIMSSTENVAYYEYSNKIITIPKTIAFVIGTVFFPRACSSMKSGDSGKSAFYYRLSLLFIYFISFGSVFGLLGVSQEFSIVYFGPDFAVCGSILVYLSPIILVTTLSNVLQNVFLIPMNKEKEYVISIVVGAAVNLVLSSVLISFMGIYGAVIGTLVAETICMLMHMFYLRHILNFKTTFLLMIPFVLSGSAMFVLIYLMNSFLPTGIIYLIVKVLAGGLVYCAILLVYVFLIDKNKKEYLTLLKGRNK